MPIKNALASVAVKDLHTALVVLTRSEVASVLDHLNGTPWLMASLLYGAGLPRPRVRPTSG